MVENHILFHSFVKTLTYIYLYLIYLLDVPPTKIIQRRLCRKGIIKASTHLWTKLFGNSFCTKCAYVWTGLGTYTVPSVNGLHTIQHEPKFVVFLHKHKGNFAYCVDSFFHVRKPPACYLHSKNIICLAFTENWFTAHLVWIVCKPLMIKMCMCVLSFILCPHSCVFTFVKGMCHSTGSDASDACCSMPHCSCFYIHQGHTS